MHLMVSLCLYNLNIYLNITENKHFTLIKKKKLDNLHAVLNLNIL